MYSSFYLYLTNSIEHRPWEANSHSVNKFPALCGTRRYIAVFTKGRHWLLSWARWVQSTPSQTVSLISSIIFWYFSSIQIFQLNFHINFSYPRACYMTCPFHPLDFITFLSFYEGHKLWSSSFCSRLWPPATSSLLDPNVHFSTLFSNTINLCSSLVIRDQVSHPCKTTSNIIVFIV